MYLSRLFKPLTFLFAALLITTGCDLANSGNDGPKDVSVKMQINTNSTAAKFKAVNLDSLTEIKFLVEELELESVSDDSADFEVEDLIVNLPLDGSAIQLTSQNIPIGLYDEFEMEIENDDDGNDVNDPDFINEGDENGYSMVIKGSYNGADFMFRTDTDFEIEMDLNPPLEISETSGSPSVAINIDPSGWFVDSNGNALDPNDPASKEIIEDNIKNSFDAEGDDDDNDDNDDDDDDDSDD
ncbi:MAG: hypothetical protein U5K71_09345 [Gracilimonas sp.]|nr:hypothetical protein [Gracilimonas sp.]